MADINGSDMVVTGNGKQLNNVDCASLLGVEIDSNLSFNEHIEKVCKKMASRIAILLRFEPVCLLNSDFSFIIALFALLCLTPTWFGQIATESVSRVLRLQKRAARVISYADRTTPSVALFNKLGWIPFYDQHKIDEYIIMYKRINGRLPNYLNEHLILNNKRHSRNTRYSRINAVCPKYKRE